MVWNVAGGRILPSLHAVRMARTTAIRYHGDPSNRANRRSFSNLPAARSSKCWTPSSVSGTRRGLPFLLSAMSSVLERESKSPARSASSSPARHPVSNPARTNTRRSGPDAFCSRFASSSVSHRSRAESAERNFLSRPQASFDDNFPVACAWFKHAFSAFMTRFNVAFQRRCRSARSSGDVDSVRAVASCSAWLFFVLRRLLGAHVIQASKSPGVKSAARLAPNCGST